MAVYNNGGNNVNALAFFTGTGDSARTEKVRIHNDGKVGIGSTNPSTILSLGGSLATGGIYINSGADEDHTIIDMTGITGGGKLIWDDSEEAFSMSKGLRVTAGSVGIGTNAPTKMLEVEGSEAEIRVHDTYSNTNNTLLSIGSDLHNTNTKDSWIKFLGGNATNDRSWAIGNRASGFFNFTYIGTRATLPATGGGNVPMVLDGINNRVGIGNPDPIAQLTYRSMLPGDIYTSHEPITL